MRAPLVPIAPARRVEAPVRAGAERVEATVIISFYIFAESLKSRADIITYALRGALKVDGKGRQVWLRSPESAARDKLERDISLAYFNSSVLM